MSITKNINYFLDVMGPDDFILIGEILAWDDEKKLAFMMAKRIYEEEEIQENGDQFNE